MTTNDTDAFGRMVDAVNESHIGSNFTVVDEADIVDAASSWADINAGESPAVEYDADGDGEGEVVVLEGFSPVLDSPAEVIDDGVGGQDESWIKRGDTFLFHDTGTETDSFGDVADLLEAEITVYDAEKEIRYDIAEITPVDGTTRRKTVSMSVFAAIFFGPNGNDILGGRDGGTRGLTAEEWESVNYGPMDV